MGYREGNALGGELLGVALGMLLEGSQEAPLSPPPPTSP